MPRCARLDIPNVVQHVMARGIERGTIFCDDRDRDEFLDRLSGVVTRAKAQLYAWALMRNHFHLVLRPRDWLLKDIMRRLMTGYAGWFNRRHNRVGHLFQNRYRSIVVEEEPYLLALVRYVHLNPVRGGVIRSPAELAAHPYTGHAVVLGRSVFPAQDAEAILRRFGTRVGEARRRYQQFVVAGFHQGTCEEFRGGGLVRSSGGWAEVLLRSPEDRELADERVLGSGEFVQQLLVAEEVEVRSCCPVEEVLVETAKKWGVEASAILGPSRERRVCRSRADFYVRAHVEAGLSYADLGRITGRTQPTVWESVQRHLQQKEGGNQETPVETA